MDRTHLLSTTLLLVGILTAAGGWSAELPGRGASAGQNGPDVSIVPASGADGAASVQSVHGYHLTPAELAKLREQVRMHWMQGRAGATADAASGLPLPEDAGRALTR